MTSSSMMMRITTSDRLTPPPLCGEGVETPYLSVADYVVQDIRDVVRPHGDGGGLLRIGVGRVESYRHKHENWNHYRNGKGDYSPV